MYCVHTTVNMNDPVHTLRQTKSFIIKVHAQKSIHVDTSEDLDIMLVHTFWKLAEFRYSSGTNAAPSGPPVVAK